LPDTTLGEGQAAHAELRLEFRVSSLGCVQDTRLRTGNAISVRKFCPPRGSMGFKGPEDGTETIPFAVETNVLLLMTEQVGFSYA